MNNKIINPIRGLSTLELILSLIIISIMVAGLIPVFGSFGDRRQLESSINNFIGDFYQAQQFSYAQRNGYKYYAVLLCSGLGPKSDRDGYKIGYYDAVPPINTSTEPLIVVKSPVEADSPEFFENTFFGQRVVFDAASKLQVGNAIIFTPEGSATSDGQSLLTNETNEIILSGGGDNKILAIVPFTGYMRVSE